MRPIGLVLMVLGFALLPASCFYLFGSSFAETGRSLVEREGAPLGEEHEWSFRVHPGSRYQLVTSLTVARDKATVDVDAAAYVVTYDVPARLELFDGKTDAPILDEHAPLVKGAPEVHEFETSTYVIGDAVVERPFSWFTAPPSGVVRARVLVGPPAPDHSRVVGATMLLYSDAVRSARQGILGVVGALVMFALGVFLFVYGHARTLKKRPRREGQEAAT